MKTDQSLPTILLSIIVIFMGVNEIMAETDLSYQNKISELIQNSEQLSDSIRLHQLFELDWHNGMVNYPERATYNGYPGQDDRWTDMSSGAIKTRQKDLKLPLEMLESIDRSSLNPTDQLSFDLFLRSQNEVIEEIKFGDIFKPVNQMGGIQQSAASVLSMMSTSSVTACENIIARLKGLPIRIDQTIQLMKTGLEKGITPPKITMRDVPQQVLSQIVEVPSMAPLLSGLQKLPTSISIDKAEEIRETAVRVYQAEVVPALRQFHQFLVNEYIPGCRESIGCSDLPNGKEWYEYLCRHYTTTNLTPQEIHEIGHSEVKRIRLEMDRIIDSVGFKGDFAEFCDFLRTDPQFYFKEERDLVREYRDISKRADAKLVGLFGTLPRLPYGVIEIPAYEAKSQTTAYYQPGSKEAGRPGYYYVNTYDLSSRPKWEMEALSLHEAVPGHHLQISIAQELEELPQFRRNSWITAYGEGWGLYAEKLGEEMGFYQDPYSRFGQLTYEIWRATRLVVDVGLHYLGWSRQEAIDYFVSNSSKSLHDITVEIDRYIVWPGQAVAYKIGELKIRELRAMAEHELGDKFDIRNFHDEILSSGPVPLDVLEQRIKNLIKREKQ